MPRVLKYFLFLVLTLFLSACATESNVIVPVAAHTEIDAIYVVQNDSVNDDNLLPNLVRELSAMGFVPIVVEGPVSPNAEYVLTYSAKITGNSVKTLSYLRIDVKKNGRSIGYAFSDASIGLSKFGTTMERLHPLMEGLFRFVEKAPMSVRSPSQR